MTETHTTKREMLERLYLAATRTALADDIDAWRDADCTWSEVADKIDLRCQARVSTPSLRAWYGDTPTTQEMSA